MSTRTEVDLPLRCPVCGGTLRGRARTFQCPDGHAFDLAREGYLNLLPDGHGRSRRSGDTASMLDARTRFLRRGHFDPLAGEVTAAVLEEGRRVLPARDAPFTVLDAGCGDGHYLAAVKRALVAGPSAEGPSGKAEGTREHAPEATGVRGEPGHLLLGFDISREAVRRAARAVPEGFFFVNDVGHRICLADGAVDVILDLFAPRNPREFGRVLRSGGALFVVIPDERHLQELRAWLPILGIEPEKRERTMQRLAPSFRFEGESAVHYSVDLGTDALRELIHMSPNSWHVTPEELNSIDGQGPLRVAVSCHLLRFRNEASEAPDATASGRDSRDQQDAGGCVAHDLAADASHHDLG